MAGMGARRLPKLLGAHPALILGAAALALHLWASPRYDVFGDELYFIICGQHPDWGYVDQPPLVPLLAAAERWLFGDSLIGLRLIPTLAAAALTGLSAEAARRLGGGLFARWLTGLAVLLAPVFLGVAQTFSTDSLQPLACAGGDAGADGGDQTPTSGCLVLAGRYRRRRLPRQVCDRLFPRRRGARPRADARAQGSGAPWAVDRSGAGAADRPAEPDLATGLRLAVPAAERPGHQRPQHRLFPPGLPVAADPADRPARRADLAGRRGRLRVLAQARRPSLGRHRLGRADGDDDAAARQVLLSGGRVSDPAGRRRGRHRSGGTINRGARGDRGGDPRGRRGAGAVCRAGGTAGPAGFDRQTLADVLAVLEARSC